MSSATLESPGLVPLAGLGKRARGTIRLLEMAGDELNRLAGFGICMGRTVELIKRGDPLILRVYGTRIGLSARLAQCIHVEPADGASPDTAEPR
ncbi:MAG TPA: FeoA family protein [Candidatus Sumerlaeota bacterium]|nr:FeoA family protein [Candidatus Sumerlaeota bacterium]